MARAAVKHTPRRSLKAALITLAIIALIVCLCVNGVDGKRRDNYKKKQYHSVKKGRARHKSVSRSGKKSKFKYQARPKKDQYWEADDESESHSASESLSKVKKRFKNDGKGGSRPGSPPDAVPPTDDDELLEDDEEVIYVNFRPVETPDYFKLLLRFGLVFAVLLVIYTLRQHIAGHTYEHLPDLIGSVVVLTGGTGGIGLETAITLMALGAKVILTVRDVMAARRAMSEILRRVPEAQFATVQCDLSDLSSVRDAADDIWGMTDHVDILVNNAGVMASPHTKTKDGYELQFATNHLGHFLLTRQLRPLLNASQRPGGARVVNVSSAAHNMAIQGLNFDDLNSERSYSPLGAYARSKLANILFTSELQRRCQSGDSKITVVACHPGTVRTNLLRYNGRLKWFFENITYPFYWFFTKSPRQGSQSVLCAALNPDLEGGEYISNCRVTTPAKQGRDSDAAKRLWEESVKMVDGVPRRRRITGPPSTGTFQQVAEQDGDSKRDVSSSSEGKGNTTSASAEKKKKKKKKKNKGNGNDKAKAE